MSGIEVNPAQLQQIAQDIETCATTIQAAIDEIDAELKRMNETVFEGQRAEALRARYLAQQATLEEFAPMLRQFGALLDGAAEAFIEADRNRA